LNLSDNTLLGQQTTILPTEEEVGALLAQLRVKAPQLVSGGDDEGATLAVALADTSLCAALGRPDRADAITVGASGTSLRQAAAASSDGFIGALLFCEWWLAEDVGDRLHEWIGTTFGEVELLVPLLSLSPLSPLCRPTLPPIQA
jgi:hypothetical protein